VTVLGDGFTVLMVASGAIFFVAGTVGLMRFPDPLSRLHAVAKADTLGLGLIVLGLLPQVDGVATAAKLLLAWVLVLFAGATASQLVARVARRDDGPGRPPA
jgi:multicomponent Na+:H+ antiporter subunit G